MKYARPRKNQKRYRKRAYRPPTANYIAKIAKRVIHKSAPTKEFRFNHGGTLDTNVLASSFHYKDCMLITAGDHVDDRTSNRIYVAGIKLNLSLANDSTTRPRIIRVMVVHTTNRDGDLLDLAGTWTNLFTDETRADYTATALSGDLVVPLNTDIIKPDLDTRITLNAEGTSGSAKVYSKYLPIRRYVHFDNDGSTTALTSGKTYLILHLCEPDNTTSPSTIRYNYMGRLFFKDA